MREIKFRAWDKRDEEMYYDAEQTYDHRCQGTGCFSGSFGSVLEDETFEVMQYIRTKR